LLWNFQEAIIAKRRAEAESMRHIVEEFLAEAHYNQLHMFDPWSIDWTAMWEKRPFKLNKNIIIVLLIPISKTPCGWDLDTFYGDFIYVDDNFQVLIFFY